MKYILSILALIVLIPLSQTVNAQPSPLGKIGQAILNGSIGEVLSNATKKLYDPNNTNKSKNYVPGNISNSFNNITSGQDKYLKETVGNTTQSNKPGFNASAPVEEYYKNATSLPSPGS